MGFQLSVGVVTNEIDLTTIIPAVSTTIGATVGVFPWGPCFEIITLSNEDDLVSRFGKPDANSYISFFNNASFLAYGNQLKVIRAVETSGANTANNATVSGGPIQILNDSSWEYTYSGGAGSVGEWAARYPGELGNSISVSHCPSAEAYSANVTSLYSTLANVTSGSSQITFTNNVVANGVVAGDLIKIGTAGYYPIVNVTASGGLTANINTSFNATSTLAVVLKKWAYADFFNGAPGTSDFAASVNGANDEMHVVVIDRLGKFSTGQGFSTGANTILEIYPYVSKASDSKLPDGSLNYYRDAIFQKSRFIHWMDHSSEGTNWGSSASGTTFTNVKKNYYYSLTGGTTTAVTDANKITAWGYYANPEEVGVDLLLTSDASTTVGLWVLQNIAEGRRDCVAFISPQFTDVVNQRGNEVTNITTTRNAFPSSSYGFMDSGWKYMFDKYNNLYRWIPLNGDIAGLCVRTDTTRDPWFSPGGYNRGSIKNAIKLAWVPNKTARDQIYPINVNPVVAFPGEGVILYGDKTMQTKPSAFDRINVRRLFIVLEKAIATASKYSLFEFNDEFTRAQFVSLVTPFLRDVQGRRGIYDFRVVCDTTNNTPEVIDRNEFIGDIYIKPARSINFIRLNFIAVRTGVSFDEIVGRF